MTDRCKWFIWCENKAVGTVAHPILGPVPTCQKCADKLQLEFERLLTDTATIEVQKKNRSIELMERSIDRIDPTLNTLRIAWRRNPDLRLGQLVSNAAGGDDAVFHVEDEKVVSGLEPYLGDGIVLTPETDAVEDIRSYLAEFPNWQDLLPSGLVGRLRVLLDTV